MKSPLLISFTILAILASTASGQVIPVFKNIDEDDNGLISKTEAKESKNSTLGKYFSKLDSNKDGSLNDAEFSKLKAAVSAQNKKERAAKKAKERARQKAAQERRRKQNRNRNRRK